MSMTFDDLGKIAHDLKERAGKMNNEAEMKKAIDAIINDHPAKRTAQFSSDASGGASGQIFKSAEDTLLKSAGSDSELREFQNWSDELLILETLLEKAEGRAYSGRASLKFYQDGIKRFAPFMSRRICGMDKMAKALYTSGTATGTEWIPTGFSSELIGKYRLELKVAALFREIAMPTDPYKYPRAGADAIAYKLSQSTSDDASKIKATTRGTSDITFTAVKIGARLLFSSEIDEDSIVPILPQSRDDLAQALANATETGIINGDTTEPHMDSDIDQSYYAEKCWDGLRDPAHTAAPVVNAGGTLTLDNISNLRAQMGKYAINPTQCAIIVGPQVLQRIMLLTEMKSSDFVGPGNQSILNGQIGTCYGMPIIVSEYIREDLATGGVYDGTTKTTSLLILVNRAAWWMGNRRGVTIKMAEDIETDQMVMVGTMRKHFRPVYDTTAEKCVGRIRNITNH